MANSVVYAGKLPENPTKLIAVSIAMCVMLFAREKPEVHIGYSEHEKVVDYFMPRFADAFDMLRAAQSGWTN